MVRFTALRKLRIEAGYKTQLALAKATGMSQSRISDIENGKSLIKNNDEYTRLANALGVAVEQLKKEL